MLVPPLVVALRVLVQLNITNDNVNYDNIGDVPYNVNKSAEFPPGSFQKIAYHLQLDNEWVFVSMEAFTDDASRIGIPVDWIHDHVAVKRLNVVSNSRNLDGCVVCSFDCSHVRTCLGLPWWPRGRV